ncbi:DUF2493 domain-containing protein [Synechococcus sp. Cruz-9H2]|uniref:SLOG family protein n=1 Tax=unclassified Synechococcus TaxID=2626047 RepID=UPI0020CC035B|nr:MULTISPECIES: SLOG family protein [unclassified Synechococcus]MCP9819842.1 DUF2493 domain-containing protein [Synechococcus sp. Cruz-9H2]MCP9844092.1 DUF2493 domain-containing protein [Synechococcus sp. Edmonson 11F2]MCP9856272.1 DUF2493 domain-containing protein [Synechococcus sp. Cruz-9C9]MCP9863557.1 DUF2493 domain-containing protein [Synechococcus sp. Cruz-7E5]MCP9870753.1 DUF2493 domain-containing protein [Synechococcus sp. Cruz-7B9]
MVATDEGLVVVASGSRDLAWPLWRVIEALRSAAGGERVQLLLHGGCRGADALADQAARRLDWPVQPMPAQWRLHGRSAGPLRNTSMLRSALVVAAKQQAEVLVIAFPGGVGTSDLVGKARKHKQGGSRLRIERVIA